MTIGAFTGAVMGLTTGNGWIAFLCAGLAGALFGLIHAFACISCHADQTIAGTAINFLGPGLALFLCKAMYSNSSDTPAMDPSCKLPKLFEGVFPTGSFWNNVLNVYAVAYLVFVLAFVCWFVFYKTRFGAHLRAVGEHPEACESLGIDVYKVRYTCVILSGFLAGLGGAFVTLATINQFRPSVIVGQGFIAIAAVILASSLRRARPRHVCCSDFAVVSVPWQPRAMWYPPNLISMIPYVVTIIALVLFVGKAHTPAANGKIFVKSNNSFPVSRHDREPISNIEGVMKYVEYSNSSQQCKNKTIFAKTVLMPGDPPAQKYIAETYLENPRQVTAVRNMFGYTGTYKGKEISVMGGGMGMPSIGIYSYELFNFYGVDQIIRIGSAGALQDHIKVMDVVIGMGACTDSNYAYQHGLPGTFAPIADYELMNKAIETAKRQGTNVVVGNVVSSDVFYNADPTVNDRWRSMGVLAVEMEAAALYMNAAKQRKSALYADYFRIIFIPERLCVQKTVSWDSAR